MTLSRLALLLALGGVAGQAEAEPALDVIDSAQWTFNKDCVAHGDTLVAVLSYGAQLWDVADPGAPQLIGDYYSAARKAIKIDWLENLLALSTQDGWVQVVDVTDPTAPVAASLNNGFGVTPAPLLQRRGGDRLLFAAGSVGLRCLDLADPASPVLRDALSLTGAPRALAAKGDTLFVLADGYGLHAVDSGNPDALVAMDSDSITAAQLLDLDVDGPRLAVAARADGIALFDVGDASNPVLVNQFLVDLGGGALRVKGVRVVGTLLFAAVDSEGFMIYDISNLASPQLLGIAPGTWYNVEELAVDGDRVYLNYWDGATAGAQIFDVSNTAAPVHLGATPAFDYCRNVEVVGDRIYTATGHQGVFLHELVGDALVQRGQFDVLNTWALQAEGDRVYVASAGEGFSIGDWSDPDAPVELGALSLGGVCRDVRVSGDLAVVAVFEHGPAFVDISNPANPTLIHQVEMGLFTVALDLRGTLLASADRTGGVNLWDIADPSAPVLLGNYDAGSNAGAVYIRYNEGDGSFDPGTVYITRSMFVPGSFDPEDDHFGRALAAGDFDGDGCVDLAIGAPRATVVGTTNDAGIVYVAFGDEQGLTTGTGSNNKIEFGMDPGAARFGFSLAAADFDGDDADELVIGAPTYQDQNDDAVGLVQVREYAGGGQGFNPIANLVGGSDEIDGWLGWSLATGDFDGDGSLDVAAGAPGDENTFVGHVVVYSGGLSSADSLYANNEDDTRFGYALAAGDLDEDGYDDLAIGAPMYTDANGPDASGGVWLFEGSVSGLQDNLAPMLPMDLAGNNYGNAQKFGSALAVGDFSGGDLDLAIGAKRAKADNGVRTGAVFMYRNTGGSLSAELKVSLEDFGWGASAGALFGSALSQ